MSLINPHDGNMLQCRQSLTITVGARRYYQLLTDDGPVYHALGVHLCRGKLITHFDDRPIRVWGKVPERSTLIFGGIRISLWHSVGQVDRSSHTNRQPDSSTLFDRTPTCDGRIDRRTDTGPQLLSELAQRRVVKIELFPGVMAVRPRSNLACKRHIFGMSTSPQMILIVLNLPSQLRSTYKQMLQSCIGCHRLT